MFQSRTLNGRKLGRSRRGGKVVRDGQYIGKATFAGHVWRPGEQELSMRRVVLARSLRHILRRE